MMQAVTANVGQTIAPTTAGRIEVLDVWRGVAVLGILFANVHAMHSSMISVDAFEGQFVGPANDFARRFEQLFVYGKFYSIFSFLFGLGIAIQARRTTRHDWKAFHVRRMSVLFVFGLLHISLLWSGDVLHLYAAIGMIAIFLLRLPSLLLVTGACFTLVFPFYESVFAWVSHQVQYAPEHYLDHREVSRAQEVFVSGSIREMIAFRWREYASNLPILLLHLAPNAFAMFLLGMAFAKSVPLNDLGMVARRAAVPVLFVAGAVSVYRVWFLFFLWETPLWVNEAWRPALIRTMEVCDSVTGLVYLWCIAIAQKHFVAGPILESLKYVGRMALTNYLLQSVLGSLLFTSVGFAYYETFSPAQLFGLVWGVIVVQIFCSHVWFRYFRFGPFEWLWRCLSYKKHFALRKTRS